MKIEINKEDATNLVVKTIIKYPNFYQVFLHNDDYTPMEFVVSMLEKFFYMDRKKAAEIMLEAHLNGKAACGMYSRDVAESKVSEVVDFARIHEHPLVCSMEAA